MWILLNKGWKHDWRLHLCLVGAAKDSHHPKLPLTYSICDDDSYWHDLCILYFLARVSDEVNSSLAQHFGGDQLGKEPLWHLPEIEDMKTREFINGCPFICREWWDQTRDFQKLFIAFCNLQFGWLGGTWSLRQLGWWPWHPVRRAKNMRFAFYSIGSMEIPGRVLLWLSYCILGLILGLSGYRFGTDHLICRVRV